MKKKILYVAIILSTFCSCKKDNSSTATHVPLVDFKKVAQMGHLTQTKTFSSDVAIKWMDLQVKLMRAYPGIIGNVAYSRHYAYSGITLYEAVVGGMPAHQSIAPQLNGLTGLPKTVPGAGYHWAASANAALAYVNKKMFPAANTTSKAAMESLEATLLAQYSNEAHATVISRSVAFGKAVAEAVISWSETDGHQNINNSYTPPFGQSGGVFWTPPITLPVHSLPYFRRMVPGSGDGAGLAAPNYAGLAEMTIEVINAKPAPGTDNYNKAFWWRDFPGTSTPGHYVSILRQVLQKEQPSLDVAAVAYALGGIIVTDITISSWQDKYKYLLARPFNYDDVIGQPFTPLLGAPHPEYPAAHASLSAANAEAMEVIFGEDYQFTDSTFFGLITPHGNTLQPRSYNSFREAGEEAGWSRLFGGIHYRPSIELGFWQGRKVAENIISKLAFRK